MAVILIFLRQNVRAALTVSVGSIGISFLSALFLITSLWGVGSPVEYKAAWMIAGDMKISFGYLLDPTSLLMLQIVATIATLVQIYSLGYMAGDPGITRYYAFQSLFAWAMMNMVIAPGMLQLYIFWELVGLASYLLIGFYYEKWSASQAGKKAFVMTRLGDIGFFLGLVFLFLGYGNLDILDINHAAQAHQIPQYLITISATLIFCGVIGKSAQFPLITWLPDAMEGPTPVSALLHSATMVAAGVYMFSRIFPFFSASADAMTVALTIGTITMLLASTMAMVANDIKQVWAYSTVSQLGFMVMALGAGGFFPGVFHLTTHAGFKALLFLCSGMFIHEYHTNDMWEIGKQGGKNLKAPMICMTIGALALSGVPLFSGFFSKEAIMGVLAAQPSKIWLIAGLAGAFMTAYYSARLIFIILFPKELEKEHHDPAKHVHVEKSVAIEVDHDPGHSHAAQGHEAGHGPHLFWLMAVPCIILASVTLVLGFAEAPLEAFLTGVHEVAEHGAHAAHEAAHGGLGHYAVMFLAIGCALSGIGLAWKEFGKGSSKVGFLTNFPAIEKLFASRWYMDDFFRWFLDRVIYGGFTNAFTRNDRRVIDGAIDGICKFTIDGGRVFSFLQSGMLQYNLLIMVGVVGVVILYFLVG
jgi:NADH-quinone oxidoreductase subunit L